MNIVGIIGRIPYFRDKILFPVNHSDGRQSYFTAREALQFQNGIESANRRALVNGMLTREQGQKSFFDFLSFLRSAVSLLTSKS